MQEKETIPVTICPCLADTDAEHFMVASKVTGNVLKTNGTFGEGQIMKFDCVGDAVASLSACRVLCSAV